MGHYFPRWGISRDLCLVKIIITLNIQNHEKELHYYQIITIVIGNF
jgi:hypothetical protein